MVGLERTVLPLIGISLFHLHSDAIMVSFIVSFGVVKAFVNLFSGALADRFGRKRILVLGWLFGLPIPFLLMWSKSWYWINVANMLLGVNQGLAWSMTVNMKIDLVGPRRRGLALGLNEAAGYGGVAIATALAGALIATISPRAVVETGGAAIALIGFAASTLFVRDTSQHVTLEQATHAATEPAQAETATAPSLSEAFAQTSFRAPGLRACSQAGLVNNLNDGLAWGLTPLFLAAHGASGGQVAVVTAIYPAVWAIGQIPAGAASDRIGRRALIVSGMLLQAA